MFVWRTKKKEHRINVTTQWAVGKERLVCQEEEEAVRN